MNAKRNPEVDLKRFVESELRSGTFTHAYFEAGRLDKDEPVSRFTTLPGDCDLFDLASLTKPIVTTTLFFSLLEKGQVSLDEPMRAWAPADVHVNDALLGVTATEILGHVSGLPAWRNFWTNRLTAQSDPGQFLKDAHAYIEEVLARPGVAIGEKVDLYSDVGFILMGYLLEKRAGKNLSQMFADFCFANNIFDGFSGGVLLFSPNASQRQGAVTTGRCAVRERELVGEVYDENCAALGGVAGHAGIFGSGVAFTRFLKRFFKTSVGVRVFEENARRVRTKKDSSLCGYRLGNDSAANAFCGGLTFGHYGFTGTAFWIEPRSLKYVVFLTNRVMSGRVNPRFREVRRQVFAAADEILGPVG